MLAGAFLGEIWNAKRHPHVEVACDGELRHARTQPYPMVIARGFH